MLSWMISPLELTAGAAIFALGWVVGLLTRPRPPRRVERPICTRVPGHTGPCNGLPRAGCCRKAG